MVWENVLAKFKELFGGEGEIGVYFAPGRVNMIGEHTDYNGGHVFPCALTIGTYGVARKRNDKKLRFYSMNFEQLGVLESSVENLKPEKEADWIPRWNTYCVCDGTEKQCFPTPSIHRLRRGLPGYLILFAPHAFEPQRQLSSSKPPSPLVFLLISTHFTATLGIPLTSPAL